MITGLKLQSITFTTGFACVECSAALEITWTHLGYRPLVLHCNQCGATHPVDARLDVRPLGPGLESPRPPLLRG